MNKPAPKNPWERTLPPQPLAPLLYWPLRTWIRLGFMMATRTRIIGIENVPRTGGCILACTHLSHVEPICMSVLLPRRIHWMARIEFYHFRPLAWFLRLTDAFPVNRFGVPVKAIRTAIERASNGKVIGMFPEGGVAIGPDSVCHGGPIKRGVSLIACRSQTPIIPCVIVGTPRLNYFSSWMPGARTPISVTFGKPIPPRSVPTGRLAAGERKRQRAEMTEELRREFVRLYEELSERN